MYYYLKYSWLFKVYQFLFKPQAGAAHKKEVRLYREIVGAVDLIFDIGAYDGHKTAAFLELSRKVVVCEPDLHSCNLLRIRSGIRRSG